ncbi:hypothetical protein ACN6LA_001165, partial [Streptomyces sp. SAS_269]
MKSGTRTVVAVPSSIAGFVGYAKRGPEHRATRISNFGDYERDFGGLDQDSELSYAIHQFFLNGGSDAYVVRVPRPDATPAKISVRSGTENGSRGSLDITALSKGAWANGVVIEVDYDQIPAADTKSFNLTATDLSTGATERFPGVSVDPASGRFAQAVLADPENGSRMVRVNVVDGAARPMATGTPGGDIDLSALKNDKNFTLKVISDPAVGAAGGDSVVVIAQGDPVPTSVAGLWSAAPR